MANVKSWVDIHGRQYLKDILPIETPLSILVEPIRLCNFKCVYCKWSSNDNLVKKYNKLPVAIFKKFCNDFKGFASKLKQLTFVGLGEPLLHEGLPQMIMSAKEISERVVLITNGSLLTKENVDKLILAGIDCIRISLQGLSAEDYLKVSNVNIDYNAFLKNIKYLYKNKQNCEVSVKIPDIALDSPEKEKLLYTQYSDCTDFIIKQKIVPVYNNISYENVTNNRSRTMNNECINGNISVCPQPFYTMQLMADCTVRPCCSSESAITSIGNIAEQSIVDIWKGESLKNYRCTHLKYGKDSIKECAGCNLPIFMDNKYDNIDDYAEELLKKFE